MVQGEYITTDEVAKLLKISPSTATRMAREGRITAIKVGKLWRFPAQSPGILLYKQEQKTARQVKYREGDDARNGLCGFLKLAADVGLREPLERETVWGGRR
jgi:excisionase family DNA binding protein